MYNKSIPPREVYAIAIQNMGNCCVTLKEREQKCPTCEGVGSGAEYTGEITCCGTAAWHYVDCRLCGGTGKIINSF